MPTMDYKKLTEAVHFHPRDKKEGDVMNLSVGYHKLSEKCKEKQTHKNKSTRKNNIFTSPNGTIETHENGMTK